MSQALVAILFPFVGVAAVGLTALFIVKPWKKRKPKSEPDVRVGDIVNDADQAILEALNAAYPDERLVLTPQARHRLHEEIAQDMAGVERLISAARRKSSRLIAADELVKSSHGGNL